MKKKTKIIYHIIIPGLFMVGIGCKSSQSLIIAEKPGIKTFSIPPPQIAESMVNLPIVLPVNKLNTLVNKEVPRTLYERSGVKIAGGAKIRYSVDRVNNISIKPQKNGELTFTIPVSVTGKLEWETPDKIGFQIGDLDLSTNVSKRSFSKDISLPYTLTFSTKLELTKDWHLNTSLLGRFDWGKIPKYSVAGYDIDFESMIGKDLQNKLNGFIEDIEKKIQNTVDLKKKVEPAWNELLEPLQISPNPPIWLVLNPKSVNFVTNQNSKMDTLKWNLGIVTRLETFIGEKPAIQPKSSLPQISNEKSDANNFTVNLPVSVTYDHLTKIIEDYGTKQIFDAGKFNIMFNAIKISSDGEKLIIFTDIQANKKGKKKLTKAQIYLVAKPVFDKTTQVISLQDVDFDINTKKAVLKVADWLAHDFILKKISESAQYSLREDIENAKREIRKTLTNLPLGDAFLLNGEINTLEFDNLFLTPNQIEVRLLAKGKLGAKLK